MGQMVSYFIRNICGEKKYNNGIERIEKLFTNSAFLSDIPNLNQHIFFWKYYFEN